MAALDPPPARDRATRQADTRALLATPAIDVWVATASAAGVPHLVPVSLAWVGERVVVAVDGGSVTARNLLASGRARLGLGPTRDVAMIDAVLERSVGVDDDPALGAAYAAQADWDPRGLAGYVFLVLRPERVQAWRESNETVGRTILRAGRWLEP
ncbi:pyridoxamine 5'-phosphate oxidase family protein [Nocardioides nitrophenolicus]|uniref:pyridoxamine 5'-phosphate oxidase family protein n=1 Tax=Nocardioides nitrophenolicus TaxID=60489 RepID=UPI0019592CAD|nr:pyridoxamine 5'-phosphate oxidase family protein [Nocardioides nitrophenolicus]MBM7520380.1 hypothetical protein [Nocardioides nitrophenolicus]